MASYFETFGHVPKLSRHGWNRLRERGISRATLTEALGRDPASGTRPGTLWYSGPEAVVVVDEISGAIVTVWAT